MDSHDAQQTKNELTRIEEGSQNSKESAKKKHALEAKGGRSALPETVQTDDPDFVVMTKAEHTELLEGKEQKIESLFQQVNSL